MVQKQNKWEKNIAIAGLVAVSILFYLVWYWHDGVVITPDSDSYINMTSDREPLYCGFLWLLRLLFGTEVSLDVAVIIQCVIAGVAASALAVSLQKRFQLHTLPVIGILFLQYAMTILNRFVAQRRYSYYNSIRVEGLAYSFWIFFFLALMGMVYDRTKRYIIEALLWSVLLISSRKQMLITLGMLFLCLIYIWWKEQKGKSVLFALGVVVCGLLGTQLFDAAYNYAVRGVFETHTGDTSFIFGTEIYLADESMAADIQDEQNREIFLEILRRADELQYNTKYEQGNSWFEIVDHYMASYDRIKFDIVNVVIREYQDADAMEEDARDADYNEKVGAMMKELLLPCMKGLVRLFCANVVYGLVTTVLKVQTVLNWIALLLYMAYGGLAIWLFHNRKKAEGTEEVLIFTFLVLLAIMANVALTSATIYCQMRYMLYNTALFYQAGIVMLVQFEKIVGLRKNI